MPKKASLTAFFDESLNSTFLFSFSFKKIRHKTPTENLHKNPQICALHQYNKTVF